MWKKNEPESNNPQYTPSTSVNQLKERATIGSSIVVRGDLSGEEDLMVQGKVEGKIDLKSYNVTIGEKGKVKADVYAKIISVEGHVEGNLFGEEKIIIRKSGRVKGNLVAPRVSLEDGSNFKGSIDMDSSTLDSNSKVKISTPKEKESTSPATQKNVPVGASRELSTSGR